MLKTVAKYDESDVTITGGTIDGTSIGATTASSGAFTTLSASGDVTIADKIVHDGDTNTSIRFPAADTVTVETSGSERVRVDSSGNLGIGTSSPGAKLDVSSTGPLFVRSSSTTAAGFEFAGNGSTPAVDSFTVQMAGSGDGYVFHRANQNLIFGTNNTERMRITSTGDVGIGTSSPSEKLEVSGNIKTSAPTGGTAAAWKLGTVATVSPILPNRTIEVEINGTTYYLHAKTTND